MQMVKPTQFQRSDSHCHRWGLILAGGDGKRLLPLTRRTRRRRSAKAILRHSG